MTVSPATPTVVDVERPGRIRNSLDGIRLVGLIGLFLMLALFGTLASDTTLGANDDLKRGVSHLPSIITNSLAFVGGLMALALPVAVVVRAIVRRQTRRLVDALIAGLLALVLALGLSFAIDQAKGSALYGALVVVSKEGAHRPFDAYLAAWLALVTVLGVTADRLWESLTAVAATVYALSTFTAALSSFLSIVMSGVLGIAVGVGLRFVAGSVNERPTPDQIADVLAVRGLPLVRIERMPAARPMHRIYRGTMSDGKTLHVDILDRDEAAYGWMYRVYRSLRVQSEVASGPELSIERTAERRSLLALAAANAGAQLPRFRGAVLCGPDTIVLAYDFHETTALDALPEPPSDDQLRSMWRSVERLHHARVSHPSLTAGQIGVEADGTVLLPILEIGTAFATDLRIALDRAQLLTTTAQLVGAGEAVRIARDELGDESLGSTLPVLQPVALGRETRHWLKQHRAVLDEVRSEIQGLTKAPDVEPFRLERVRPRTVVSLAALIVAGWLLIGQLGSLDLASVLRDADYAWVPFLLLASAGTYVAATVSLIGFVRERLSVPRTFLAQLAGSFTSFVTPPAVGGFAVNVRFLHKAGLSTGAAATSVGVSQVVNVVLHILLLLAFAAATGTSAEHQLPIPSWAFFVVGVVALLLLITLAVPLPRRWVLGKVLPPLREAGPRLLELVTSPVKLVEALGGALLLNACYIGALWCAVQAFNGDVSFVGVAVVYLAGGAIGSLAPTPGGLGAVEAALAAGLTAAHMPGVAAVSAVLLFRVATFWLPVPIGWVALKMLQAKNAL